jgi:hypothetical protein
MKHIILTFGLTIIACAASAQSSSVVTNSVDSKAYLQKLKDLETKIIGDHNSATVDGDIEKIIKEYKDWDNIFSDEMSNCDNPRNVNCAARNRISANLEELNKYLDTYLRNKITNDPINLPGGEQDPTKKDYVDINNMPNSVVNGCSKNYPRLIYDGNKWRCMADFSCDDLNFGTNGVYKEVKASSSSAPAVCQRPQTDWSVSAWSSCNGSYKQTRTVKCVLVGSTTDIGDSNCTGPKPLTSRNCVN